MTFADVDTACARLERQGIVPSANKVLQVLGKGISKRTVLKYMKGRAPAPVRAPAPRPARQRTPHPPAPAPVAVAPPAPEPEPEPEPEPAPSVDLVAEARALVAKAAQQVARLQERRLTWEDNLRAAQE